MVLIPNSPIYILVIGGCSLGVPHPDSHSPRGRRIFPSYRNKGNRQYNVPFGNRYDPLDDGNYGHTLHQGEHNIDHMEVHGDPKVRLDIGATPIINNTPMAWVPTDRETIISLIRTISHIETPGSKVITPALTHRGDRLTNSTYRAIDSGLQAFRDRKQDNLNIGIFPNRDKTTGGWQAKERDQRGEENTRRKKGIIW